MKNAILIPFVFLIVLISCSDSNDMEDEIIQDLPPTPFSISISDLTDRSAMINWTAAVDPEEVNVKYNVYLDDQLVGDNISDISLLVEDLDFETNYSVKIVATDGVKNTTVNFAFTTNPFVPKVYEGDVILQTQQEVIDFSKDRYNIIKGSLKILSTEVTDISSLLDLMSIEGLLEVSGTSLVQLQGLHNLSSASEEIQILGNGSLVNIESLMALETFEGNLVIYKNESLLSLKGLEGLTNLYFLSIYDNESLENLNGLDNIVTTEQIQITKNRKLTDISGLNKLTSVGELFEISENITLPNLDGLENLTSIGSRLLINRNFELSSISGLGNLSTIEGGELGGATYRGVIIVENKLEDLGGLNSLMKIDGSLILQERINSGYLLNLKGLDNLKEITKHLWIMDCSELRNLEGLEGLTAIGRDCQISNNKSLESLNGLQSLESVIGNMMVIQNQNLVNLCSLQNLYLNNGANGSSLEFGGGKEVYKEDIIDGNCSK